MTDRIWLLSSSTLVELKRRVEPEPHLYECPVCGHSKLESFLESKDYHYGNTGTFRTVICPNCGLVALDPMPDARQLSAYYPKTYYSFQRPSRPAWWRTLLRKLLLFDRQTYMPKFATPGTALDVGCGSGEYLLQLRLSGWTVFGIEPSIQAAEAGRSAGLDIRATDLASAGFDSESFDFIRSNHSFEHIPDPNNALKTIHHLLKPNGKLVIGVPNFSGLWARLFKRHWWYLGLPVHTYQFTPQTLTALLRKNGFAVEQVRYNSEFAGFLGSLQIRSNDRKGAISSTGAIYANRLLHPPAYWFSRFLDLMKMGDCIEVVCHKAP